MTFSEWLEKHSTERDPELRIAMRWLMRRCRRNPEFAESVEEEVTNQMVTHQAKIDWSKIDWLEVAKIVISLLVAFNVLQPRPTSA